MHVIRGWRTDARAVSGERSSPRVVRSEEARAPTARSSEAASNCRRSRPALAPEPEPARGGARHSWPSAPPQESTAGSSQLGEVLEKFPCIQAELSHRREFIFAGHPRACRDLLPSSTTGSEEQLPSTARETTRPLSVLSNGGPSVSAARLAAAPCPSHRVTTTRASERGGKVRGPRLRPTRSAGNAPSPAAKAAWHPGWSKTRRCAHAHSRPGSI